MNKKIGLAAMLLISFSSAHGSCTRSHVVEMVDKVCSMEIVQQRNYDALKANRKILLSEHLIDESCKDNYVWVQDEEVRMISHPIKTKLNDKIIAGFKDPDGTPLFAHFSDVVTNGPNKSGWVGYKWAKPNELKDKPKVSYVKKCQGGLIAGSGLWLEDLSKQDRDVVIRFVNESKKYLKTK